MKTIISNHALKNKLWIALLVGAVGLSACSNEVEETPDSTVDTTEATAVGTEPANTEVEKDITMSETTTTTNIDTTGTDSPMDPAGTATTDEMTDGSVIGDSTMVDEDNTSFNQDPVESTQ
ncbi:MULTISPECIES: hypothetical protein [unclassified Psychrobacter]|uniref:hypothetical protein n=1 Tax=unclassified Psychrobacter TaxID=196806 RepID=UPI0018F3A9F4|nr:MULTISPECIES: hypothetical protein [unclassified Psychrobacter]